MVSIVSTDDDSKNSPPRVYNASEHIAFFSSSVKGTKGSTVVILDKTEAYQIAIALYVNVFKEEGSTRTPSLSETFGLSKTISSTYSSLDMGSPEFLRES